MTFWVLELQLNFNLLILFVLLTSCGLKKPPTAPGKKSLPSVIEKYSKKEKKDGANSRSGK